MKKGQVLSVVYSVLWVAVVLYSTINFVMGDWLPWLEISVFIFGALLAVVPFGVAIASSSIWLWESFSWFRAGGRALCFVAGVLVIAAPFFWKNDPFIKLFADITVFAAFWLVWKYFWPGTPNPWAWAYKRIRE